MKIHLIVTIVFLAVTACYSPSSEETSPHEQPGGEPEGRQHAEDGRVALDAAQRAAIGLKVDTLPLRNLTTTVMANGSLEVPPQNEADVSVFLGGNIRQINVIEGDRVRKGQPLALLEHPDFIEMQTDFRELASHLEFLKAEYQRQQRLYDGNAGAGQDYQRARSEHQAAQARYEGLRIKLNMLGIRPDEVLEGKLARYLPVPSPISGAVKKVLIRIGQHVEPNASLFELVDNHHIHADLMVFEKDVSKIRAGQQVHFTVANQPGQVYRAEVYAIGSVFEDEPRALHLHADIKNANAALLPGMYIQGRITVDNYATYALPTDGIVQEGGKSYLFVLEEHPEEHATAGEEPWIFRQVEVMIGAEDMGWIEARPLEELPPGAMVAHSGAYYLLSERQKEELEHTH
ncbi:MAG: efflux RND transporter periplasmic adaptor subunit [Phaeodactylibacter sp.]|nr:efflux RND transporter periplasmic adaptor subunit [Phaeodactylibacter sp.]MCB0614768.1 efflux RND transporter periplasmic adaptor subunit [Phaeodactylibacter sp.]